MCAGVNEDGSPMGLFGHNSDLDWHCNRPSAENERKPIVFLYAVNASTGSRISWLNNSLSYNDLSITNKKWLENKKGIYGFKPNTYTKNFNVWKPHKNTVGQKFIRENAVGQKGMFFPIHQFFGFKDVDENISKDMTQLLYQHAYQEKYMYHHDYEDGDIIFGDQWLTVHKRWACELGNRMLYRITMDWMNIQI